MVGDLDVQFIVRGPNGATVVLTRLEAERLLTQLAEALKHIGEHHHPDRPSTPPKGQQ